MFCHGEPFTGTVEVILHTTLVSCDPPVTTSGPTNSAINTPAYIWE